MSKSCRFLLLASLPILLVACAKEKEADLPELPAYTEMAEAGPPLSLEQCSTRAWEIEVTAQREWYQALRDLAASRYADVLEAVDLGYEYQKIRLDQRGAQFRYLLENHPESLVVDRGAATFKNLPWMDADTAGLTERDPSYATLENRVLDAHRKYTGHSNYRRATEVYRDDLTLTERYGEMVNRHEARDKEIELMLSRCEGAQPREPAAEREAGDPAEENDAVEDE